MPPVGANCQFIEIKLVRMLLENGNTTPAYNATSATLEITYPAERQRLGCHDSFGAGIDVSTGPLDYHSVAVPSSTCMVLELAVPMVLGIQ